MADAVKWAIAAVVKVASGPVGKLGQKVAVEAVKNGARQAALKTALVLAKKAAFQIATAAVVNAVFAPSLGGASGRPVQFTADPNSPIPLVLGRSASAGTIVARLLSGPGGGNKFETFFGVLSFAGDAGGCEAIESFRANELDLEFHATTHKPSEGPNVYYQDVMYQWTQLGEVGDPAFTDFEFTPTDWTEDHKFTGYCGFAWVLRDAPKKYAGGEPVPLWVVKGPSVYDPRQDSTYPGGSGAQRSDDPTTWTDMVAKYNPFLQGLAWARGWRNNGILCLGAGLPDAGIAFADFVEGANVADDNGWVIGGTVYSDDPKFTVLEQMLRAGGGRPVTGAQLGCTVQQPRVSIATITGADIDGFPSISTIKGWRDTFNSVTVKCLQEDQGWKSVPVGRIEVEDWVDEDGEVHTEEIEFPYVPEAAQAAQLAVYDAGESREGGPYVLPLRPYFIGLRAGDCIELVEAAFGIPSAVKLVVSRRTREPMTGSRVVTCWTDTAAKHTLALAASLTPVAPTPTPPDLPIDSAIIFNSYVVGSGILTAADVGATTTITIASHVRRYSDGDVDVAGGTVTGLAFATGYSIYYDDSLRDGGTVTYHATVDAIDALTSSTNPARHFVGYIVTPADGGGGTTGGGSKPPGWDPDFPSVE